MEENMTLIEKLNKIRDLYRSVAFDCSLITQNMHCIDWTDKERLIAMDCMKISLDHIDRLQKQIERGQYREENPYAV